jgi:hypothetical protein
MENFMNRRNILSLSVLSVVGFALLPNGAMAQQKTLKEQIIGSWALTSWEQTYTDGHKDKGFGDNPKGIQNFDLSGRFTIILLRPDIPRVASKDRVTPTPAEAMAIAKGVIAYYGTYTVNETEKSIDLKIESTSFTNQMDAPQKRTVTAISADEMKMQNPTSASGGKIEYVFKRVN